MSLALDETPRGHRDFICPSVLCPGCKHPPDLKWEVERVGKLCQELCGGVERAVWWGDHLPASSGSLVKDSEAFGRRSQETWDVSF